MIMVFVLIIENLSVSVLVLIGVCIILSENGDEIIVDLL